MNHMPHAVNTFQRKQDHLAVFICIFAVTNIGKPIKSISRHPWTWTVLNNIGHPLPDVSASGTPACSSRNTTVDQICLWAPYTDRERHNAQRHRRTDERTTASCQEPIILRAAVRSAKNSRSLVICNKKLHVPSNLTPSTVRFQVRNNYALEFIDLVAYMRYIIYGLALHAAAAAGRWKFNHVSYFLFSTLD